MGQTNSDPFSFSSIELTKSVNYGYKIKRNRVGTECERGMLRVETKVRVTPLRGMCQVNNQDSPVSLNQGGIIECFPQSDLGMVKYALG